MEEKIVKFLECLIPVSICNLECEYCYIIQNGRRKMENPKLNYDIYTISKALSKKRLGGMAYISICGAGETLVSDDVIELIKLLLEEGHAVNITTNGTLNQKINKIISFPKDYLKRLNFSFSFHYIELEKKNLLKDFFDNILKVKAAGCSFVLQCNLYDGYVPYIDKIKKLCYEKVGAFPQIALTRRETRMNNKVYYEIFTDGTREEYVRNARKFESPLFECTLKNFNVKRKEFCYAGLWSGVLNLQTGMLKKCYGLKGVNIFENIDEPIKFEAIGNNCPLKYCVNSSHFLALGVMPECNIPTYAQLRNRESAGWYNNTMKKLLDNKFYDTNKQYNWFEKIMVNIVYRIKRVFNING